MNIVRSVRNKLPRIAIAMGDPAGIGPEVILKSLKHIKKFCKPLIICDKKFLKKIADKLNIKLNDKDILDLENINFKVRIGRINKLAGKVSAEYIKKAVELALKNEVKAIVTAPINKESLKKDKIDFPGQTEMLAKLTNTRNFAMMLIGDFLRVVLVTTHVSIKDVSKLINKNNIYEKIKLTSIWLKEYFKIKKPVMAVAGLNPHSGENGLFGNEEVEKIIPAIKKARRNLKVKIVGPVPPDALFYKAKKEKYDAIVCMYHDQGLIPLKMIAFEKGVNITLGLPIIRTSPDHGTAYDIAGKGIANPNSFMEAVKLAAFLAKG
ncbi:MAG: 4-hydroxythreonine-4-phosphate dehydrogenase PdxA [Candidatus Firestonebacteria bacterium]